MAASNVEAFEALKTYLVNNYNAKVASGGREIVKRCHFCGDSRDASSRHLYIGLTNEGAILYNCFKCQAKGIVDGKFLRDMGSYDSDIMMMLQEHNSKLDRSGSRSSGALRNQKIFRDPYLLCNDSPLSQKKLDYLTMRFGVVFNRFDAAHFKIILNLKEFLHNNGITQYTRYPDLVDKLNDYYVGFLTTDNTHLSLRRLCDEGIMPKQIDTRYVIYNIFGDENTAFPYYTIPSSVDLNRSVEVHITEGAIDLISVYMYVAPMGSNAIYAAVGGKSYMALIRFLIVNYGIANFTLHIYPDEDVKPYAMERIKEDLAPFNLPIFIHRNSMDNEKDYGVPMNRINDTVWRIN